MKVDLRTTLHWELNIKTLRNKNTQMLFFNCDNQADYIIEILGIPDTGMPI